MQFCWKRRKSSARFVYETTFGCLFWPVLLTYRAGETSSNEEEEPAQKKKRDQLLYVQSEEFQKILNAKSRHGAALQAVWQSHAFGFCSSPLANPAALTTHETL